MEFNEEEKREVKNLFYDQEGDRWLCFNHEIVLLGAQEAEKHKKCFVVRSGRNLGRAEGLEQQTFGTALYNPNYFPSELFVRMLVKQRRKEAQSNNLESLICRIMELNDRDYTDEELLETISILLRKSKESLSKEFDNALSTLVVGGEVMNKTPRTYVRVPRTEED